MIGLGDSTIEARRDAQPRVPGTLDCRPLHDEYHALSSDLLFRVDVAIEIAYGLLRRAYAEEEEARTRLLRHASEVVGRMTPRR